MYGKALDILPSALRLSSLRVSAFKPNGLEHHRPVQRLKNFCRVACVADAVHRV